MGLILQSVVLGILYPNAGILLQIFGGLDASESISLDVMSVVVELGSFLFCVIHALRRVLAGHSGCAALSLGRWTVSKDYKPRIATAG